MVIRYEDALVEEGLSETSINTEAAPYLENLEVEENLEGAKLT